ncbi:MAG: glmZ(sRNA)-inactivating NTPase [Clostridiaceae bacterium BRH_c20a]|nr:MAG: glmZ(sRNA)-inactivating NTPase [Clostridiaceae bacterium BRH_c20a]
MAEIRFLIITGLSGAGKTQAVRSLEDLHYFCVDNLPPSLIPKFAELCTQSKGEVNKVALVIDIRGGQFFDDLFAALEDLKAMGIYYEILFLEAANEILVNRFKETRRRHPLSAEGSGVMEGIKIERERLQELRGRANKIIDTSELKPNHLKEEIQSLWGKNGKGKILSITVMSFGYKYGIPLDTDLLVDVRFLPNPYYIPELKALTGSDQEIQDYVFKSPISKEFIDKYYDLLNFLIPNYITEGKTHLVIAIGCTGGRHRSVALANRLGQLLASDDYQVTVKHRDIEKQGVND